MCNFGKIGALILIISFCFTLSKGQEPLLSDIVTVTVHKGTLQSALQTLSDKTGIRFGYRTSLIENKLVETGNFRAPLEQILDELLGKNGLCYTYRNKQIIIHTNCLPRRFIVSGTIADDSLLEPIPFAFINLSGKPEGVIADENGYFEMELEINNQDKALVASSMGFLRDSITINGEQPVSVQIMLKRKVYSIEEVPVNATDFYIEKAGNTRERASGSLYLDTHGQQTALFISGKKKTQGQLLSIEYFLSDDGNTDAPFRVRVYAADSNGMPGEDLIPDPMVIKPEMQSGWFTINLEKLSIEVPEKGLFIAIEGVFPDDYDQYFGESQFIDLAKQGKMSEIQTLSYGQRIGYNRKCRKETWHFSLSKVWFQLHHQSFGVMISAVVRYRQENRNENFKHNE